MDDTSLSPSLAILDHCQILREIMVVYQSSLLGDEDETTRVSGFRKELDIMVDPVLETIVAMSEDKKRLRPKWDQPVYVLNSLTYLQVASLARLSNNCLLTRSQTVLEPYQFTSEKREVIQGVVDGRVAFLINDHVRTSIFFSILFHFLVLQFVKRRAVVISTKTSCPTQALTRQWRSARDTIIRWALENRGWGGKK